MHSDGLWQVVSDWMLAQPQDTFIELLPLLRRTFGSFSAPERRQLGERARHGSTLVATRASSAAHGTDLQRARRVVPILATILGASKPEAVDGQ